MSKKIKNQREILAKLRIEKLNDMQVESQLAIHSSSEVVILSPTGTGKTLAFLLPAIAELNINNPEVQMMIITPTRELAIQVCEAIKSDSKLKLRHAIKISGINARAISKGLVCNGYDPVTFAIVNKAQHTAEFMARKSDIDYEALLAKL